MPVFEGSSFTGAVATPHTLATDAATEAFRDGGSALDAAIAAAAVLTVVYPHNVALGGDLIALVRSPDGTVTCVNASGWAGAAVDVDAMRAKHGAELPARGADTVTVPGGVRGWETLHGIGGRLPWHRLMQPARRAADVGVPIAASVGAHLVDPENADLHGSADFDRAFRPGGHLLQTGDDFRQPALAATFAALADGGPDVFYRGDVAAGTVRYLRSHGSVLDEADFADFQPEITAPASVDFRGLVVSTSPPNTHGFIMLRALAAIEEFDTGAPLGDDLATLMRVFHHGNRLRAECLADPRQAAVDLKALVHDDLRAATPVGDAVAARSVPRGDTVGVAAADGDGWAVSLIQSVYHAFGSGLVDPDTGILFHDRGTSFSLDAGSPNVLAPRKRPLHTLMPVIVTKNGEFRHVLSTMGGQGQPQILTQVLLRMLDGRTAAEAVAAPRAVVGQQALGCTDDSVVVEVDADADALASLEASSFETVVLPRHSETLGQTNVVRAGADGELTAAADPRADGSAVVVQYARHRRMA
ncbi:gamma-glutamyltranspeptidase [Mycolicibacterium sp. P1-18]|uniref:gamma-glutamyltransferase family protein n=1 Tax=Mycolicibacterium sp. P1-18 TaxID=2024615 RepID=UPI0011F1EA0F|nr:gamma-glutamyltransferase [Mycolicibacterium sp. P1-18]KAA0090897.1 gamma-glutamyltranspeptidase [Mycolicibacterium sp. P1-18]